YCCAFSWDLIQLVGHSGLVIPSLLPTEFNSTRVILAWSRVWPDQFSWCSTGAPCCQVINQHAPFGHLNFFVQAGFVVVSIASNCPLINNRPGIYARINYMYCSAANHHASREHILNCMGARTCAQEDEVAMKNVAEQQGQ